MISNRMKRNRFFSDIIDEKGQKMLTGNSLRILSVGVGILLLFYGVDKVMNGIDFIVTLLRDHHIPYPEYLAYGVYIGEVVAPLMLIMGRNVPLAGALIAIDMIVAIWLVHSDHLFEIVDSGAWSIELPMLYLLIGVTLASTYKPKS